MKTFLTDEFLWDVYNFLQEAGNVLDSVFAYPTMRNFLPGPKNPIFKKYRKENGARKFSMFMYYLKRKGYIKVKNLDGKDGIILTKEGISRAIKAGFKLDRKKRKDKKWIMLMFDIPEKYKKSRVFLRGILIDLGYKIFQKSVWITPYDVSDKTEKFLQSHGLDQYVKIFLIEKI